MKMEGNPSESRYWEGVAWFILRQITFFSDLVVGTILLFWICPPLEEMMKASPIVLPINAFVLVGGISLLVFAFLKIFLAFWRGFTPQKRTDKIQEWREYVYFFSIPTVLLMHLPRGIWWLVQRVPGVRS